MKALRYILVFFAGCCFAGVGIGVLIIAFGAYQSRMTPGLPESITQSNAPVEATAMPPTYLSEVAPHDVSTPTPLPSATPTSLPTVPPPEVASPIPAVTPTPLESAIAPAVARIATANRDTEIYQGPGTNFNIIGTIAPGQPLALIGVSLDGHWYQLVDGGWIAAYVVDSLHSTDLALTPVQASEQVAQVPTILPTMIPMSIQQAASTGSPESLPAPTAILTPAPIQATGPTYQQVCVVDESSMTDPQIAAFANQYVGQTFAGWQTWVYDVVDKSGGTYDLLLSVDERGFLWTRDIVIENIPQELAFSLNVEQPLILSGRIARNEVFWETVCNPLVVDSYVLRMPGVAQPIADYSSTSAQSHGSVQAVTGDMPDSPTLTVLSHSARETPFYLYINGEIQNQSSFPVKGIKIVAVLRDANGNVVDTGYGYARISTLPPNGKSPFSIALNLGTGMAYYDLIVEGERSESPRQDLVIRSHGSRQEGTKLYLFGEIENTGTVPAKHVNAVITMYDSHGRVIDSVESSTTLDTIPPGGTAAFSTSTSQLEGFSYYEIQVEGQ